MTKAGRKKMVGGAKDSGGEGGAGAPVWGRGERATTATRGGLGAEGRRGRPGEKVGAASLAPLKNWNKINQHIRSTRQEII